MPELRIELLERLSNTPGVSGFEDAVQELVSAELRSSCDEVSTDRLGNVIGLRRATGTPTGARAPRVVLAAHCDEIGMMVKHIGPDGTIHIHPIGGLHASSLLSQRVTIHGRKPVKGVVAPTTRNGIAAGRKRERVPALSEIVIDVGLPVEEVLELIEVGDPITLAQEFEELNDRVVMGRNFDDRIGTFCLLEAMARVGPTAVDVYAVSTVQEEVGVRGMPVAAYAIEPDIGIALDGSCCRGPYSEPHDQTCDLGAGTGVYLIDNRTIGDRRLLAFLFDLAAQHAIPVQRNIGGGTDASAIQQTGLGALATTIGAPVQYMHSTVQLCHKDDIEATIRLLTAFLEHAHELETA